MFFLPQGVATELMLYLSDFFLWMDMIGRSPPESMIRTPLQSIAVHSNGVLFRAAVEYRMS